MAKEKKPAEIPEPMQAAVELWTEKKFRCEIINLGKEALNLFRESILTRKKTNEYLSAIHTVLTQSNHRIGQLESSIDDVISGNDYGDRFIRVQTRTFE